MATHSSVIAWRIPGMGERGGLPSMESHRVGHEWSDLAAAAGLPVFLSFGVLSSLQYNVGTDRYLSPRISSSQEGVPFGFQNLPVGSSVLVMISAIFNFFFLVFLYLKGGISFILGICSIRGIMHFYFFYFCWCVLYIVCVLLVMKINSINFFVLGYSWITMLC